MVETISSFLFSFNRPDLRHEGSHLQSQLLVHREVALLDLVIHLVGQQEALPLRFSFHLSPETQSGQGQTQTARKRSESRTQNQRV